MADDPADPGSVDPGAVQTPLLDPREVLLALEEARTALTATQLSAGSSALDVEWQVFLRYMRLNVEEKFTKKISISAVRYS